MRLRPALGYGSAFVALSALGRLTLQSGSGLAFFWPAAGIGVAWLLRCRTHREAWIASATVLTGSTLIALATGALPAAALLLGVGNLAVAGAPRQVVLALRGIGAGSRRRGRPVATPAVHGAVLPVVLTPAHFLLLLAGVVVGAVLSSPAGMAALLVGGMVVRPMDLVGWLVRNAVGALTVAGTVLAVAGALSVPGRPRRASTVETVLLLVATLGSVWLVFRPGQQLALAFVPMAVVAWAGMRLRPGWAAVQGLLLGVCAVIMVRFVGITQPLADSASADSEVLIIQLYLGLTFGLALGVSLVSTERDLIANRLRQSEQTARERAEQLRAITETVQDGLVVIDRTGRTVLRNPVAQALLGTGEEISAATGHGLLDLSGRPLDQDDFPSRRALRGESVRDVTVLLPHGDGPPLVLAVDAAPLRRPSDRAAGNGEPVPPQQAVVVFRDVTLAHERVELLENFAATVAHDLQNPIASVQGWADNAIEELDDRTTPDRDGRVRQSLQRIANGGDRAQRLVNDLLGYSTARTAPMREVRVDLDRLVDSVTAEVVEHEPERGIRVTHGPLGSVLVDRGMFRQLLANLIGNAVKYTDSSRTPRIDVQLTRTGTRVALTVTDNGIGVPAAHRDRIFEAFHRAPTHGRYPGTGLGLAICALVARRHGGSIAVTEGPDGQGSVFTVYLDGWVVGAHLPDPAVAEGPEPDRATTRA